jgi:hypothetical protein
MVCGCSKTTASAAREALRTRPAKLARLKIYFSSPHGLEPRVILNRNLAEGSGRASSIRPIINAPVPDDPGPIPETKVMASGFI